MPSPIPLLRAITQMIRVRRGGSRRHLLLLPSICWQVGRRRNSRTHGEIETLARAPTSL